MWISMPTPVTNSSQMLESGSSRKPASAWNGAWRPVMGRVVHVAGVGAEPGVEDGLIGLVEMFWRG